MDFSGLYFETSQKTYEIFYGLFCSIEIGRLNGHLCAGQEARNNTCSIARGERLRFLENLQKRLEKSAISHPVSCFRRVDL